MEQAKLLLLFVVVFTMLFAACANPSATINDHSQPPKPSDSETEEVLDSPEPNDSITEKALVNVDYATEEILNKYDSFSEFTEFEDEGFQKIVFTTNIAVKDFKFIEVGFKDDNIDFTFFESGVLYSLEELSPVKPFVVTWLEQGSIPHRGISFMDETGATRYFCITMSGEDGSVFLAEFNNE